MCYNICSQLFLALITPTAVVVLLVIKKGDTCFGCYAPGKAETKTSKLEDFNRSSSPMRKVILDKC